MGTGQKRNIAVVPEARAALDSFRNEVATEMGIHPPAGYWGDIPSRTCGAVGGHMVRRMVEFAQQHLVSGGFAPHGAGQKPQF